MAGGWRSELLRRLTRVYSTAPTCANNGASVFRRRATRSEFPTTSRLASPVTVESRPGRGPCGCSKQVVTTLSTVPLFEVVSIPFVTRFLAEAGSVQANEIIETAAIAMLNELQRWVSALSVLRTPAAKPI
jgi:hypothetical protein